MEGKQWSRFGLLESGGCCVSGEQGSWGNGEAK